MEKAKQQNFYGFISPQLQDLSTLDPHSCQKSPLRRHSLSAPARLCLGRLDIATKQLGQRILSLSSLVSKSSLALSQPGSLGQSTPVLLTDRMNRTCHGCHAPIDDDHKDYPSGWQKCPLDHWTGCQGGIAEGKAANGSEWRACPPEYVFVEAVSTDDEDLEDGLSKKDISITTGDETSEVAASALNKQANPVLETNLELVDEEEVAKNGSDLELVAEDTLVRQLEEANKLLKQQVANRAKEEEAARARKVAILKAENLRLSRAMGGDIGGAKVKTASGSRPHPKNQKTGNVVAKPAHNPIQEHMSRKNLRASEYRPEDDSIYTGLDIKGIRKIPELQSQVEKLVSQVQQRAPSLDRRPSFVPVRETPPGVAFADQQHEDEVVVEQFVYKYGEDGTLRKVKVLTPQTRGALPSLTRSGGSQVDDLETSSDEDCAEVPQPGHAFKWMRDENGEKYFTEVRQVTQQQEMVYRYVKDGATGRSYKRLVMKNDPDKELVSQWVIDPDTGRKVKMLVPCQLSSVKPKISKQSSSQPVRFASSPSIRDLQSGDGFATPLPSSRTSQQSSSSIPPRCSSVLQDDKQGKMPTIVQFARNCPVHWTTKITSDKLNMGLWCWSFIAELLATSTGQASSLPPGELEARMQHFLNVLEIALQPSAPTDFENHAWKVARLYAEKVQHKIERGDSWLGFEQRYGSDSQPHELMAAEKELAPKALKAPKQPKEEDVKLKDGEKKRTCSTWNSSTTEGKCEYEVQYEGKSCSRRHECSWCKDKGKRSLGHQRSFCRQRIAAGDQ